MKNLLKKVREKKGFISVETIIIAGFLILFGMVSFSAYMKTAGGIVGDSITELEDNYEQIKPELEPEGPVRY